MRATRWKATQARWSRSSRRGCAARSPDVLARLGRGEEVDPSLYYFRTVMRFETAHPSTAWLNRILALAKGAREKNAVRLEVYEVL